MSDVIYERDAMALHLEVSGIDFQMMKRNKEVAWYGIASPSPSGFPLTR
jgi:hypothetical protein